MLYFGTDIQSSQYRYLRYALSYRDLEEMMRERGLYIDHTTIYRSRATLRTRIRKALPTSSQYDERLVVR
jgi:transposase-like protein